jgi:hypothetical protein
MRCVIATESMLSALAISTFLKVLDYSQYGNGSEHVWKSKQSSSTSFGFSEVRMNIIIIYFVIV